MILPQLTQAACLTLLSAIAFLEHAHVGPLWVVVGFLWDSGGRAKPTPIPCGPHSG